MSPNQTTHGWRGQGSKKLGGKIVTTGAGKYFEIKGRKTVSDLGGGMTRLTRSKSGS